MISLNELALVEPEYWDEWFVEYGPELSLTERLVRQGQWLFAFSQYARQQAGRTPDLMCTLLESNVLSRVFEVNHQEALAYLPQTDSTEADFMRQLRQFRNYHMLWIYWRDLAGDASLEETCSHVSWLADQCIEMALIWAHGHVSSQFQIAPDDMLPLIILAMGKYGAYELNVSSDIDLIFCFTDEQPVPEKLRSQEIFYTRLGQKLIQLLDIRNADGFVFRVDMRLRPYGDSGALVMSESAMEAYYLEQGRDWERFALIKARILTGTEGQKASLKKVLKPFVFRRYVDFSVLDSPRQMKQLIEREIRRRNLGDNIKLGAGGIREIEFTAQALQLIHGGKEPSLQCRPLLEALPNLVSTGLLDQATVTQLTEAYYFLRLTEHRLQAYNDSQTQTLPTDETLRHRLALSMGYQKWVGFSEELARQRQTVHAIFSDLFATAANATDNEADIKYQDLWQTAKAGESVEELITECGLAQEPALIDVLTSFSTQSVIKNMAPRGELVLNQLMPLILRSLRQFADQATCLQRVIKLISAIISRTAYLELLRENTAALEQMMSLCSKSILIADYLADYPYVLDELLNPTMLLNPGSSGDFSDLLRQHLSRIPLEDIEARMDALREVRQTQLLRLSAADTAGVMDINSLGLRLSEMAAIVVAETLLMAWHQIAEKHGTPESESTTDTPGFCVIAYGKFGAEEMGYSSDLDLVFIYDDVPGQTTGAHPVENKIFYMRMAQKMIHLLNTRTRTGVLYEVDMRLRPSGNSGLLVTEINAFESYQQHEAWTWEHQALIRARPICGDAHLAERFEAIRKAILCQSREPDNLRTEVCKMRERMRQHMLEKVSGDRRDFKQSAGGLADIEFLLQYWVLLLASEYPDLSNSRRTGQLLSQLQQLRPDDSETIRLLKSQYDWLREQLNEMSLQKAGVSRHCSEQELARFAQIQLIWEQLFGRRDD